MKAEVKYFNFPVCLLKDFLSDTSTKKCLGEILDYAIYAHANSLEYGTELERIKSAANFFGVLLGHDKTTLQKGKALFNSIDSRAPKVGINLTVFWDYYKHEKTPFEKACLLGFLAIKSIVQKKAYIKITNAFWLSRMAGFAKNEALENLPANVLKYSNEYQTKKIKTELKNNWGLVTYSRYNRGFYVSFSLPLEQLVFEAEKRRKSNIEKQYKQKETEAVKNALAKLGVSKP